MPDDAQKGPVKLPRTAKGKKPQYFQDPAIDKLLSMVMTLMQELSVTRDRLDTLERLVEQNGGVKQSEIDGFELTDEIMAVRSKTRSAYIARVLKSVQDEVDALTGDESPGQNVPDPPED